MPDFEWLAQPEKAPLRLVRNREMRREAHVVGALRARPRAELGLTSAPSGIGSATSSPRPVPTIRARGPAVSSSTAIALAARVQQVGVRERQRTTGRHLHRRGAGDPARGRRRRDRAAAAQLIGQRILSLGRNGLKKFSVTFRVDPHPSEVQGLAKLRRAGHLQGTWSHRPRAQQDGVDLEATRRNHQLHQDQREWEEGWHFVRVLAKTESGDLIPLVDTAGNPIPWAQTMKNPSSDRTKAISSTCFPTARWTSNHHPAGAATRGERGARASSATVHRPNQRPRPDDIAVTPELGRASTRNAERWQRHARGEASGATARCMCRCLAHSRRSSRRSSPRRRSDQLAHPDRSWQRRPSSGGRSGWPRGEATARFLAARDAYFEAVRAGTTELVTQAADAGAHAPQPGTRTPTGCLSGPAKASRKATTDTAQRALTDLRQVLAVDSVTLAIRDHRDRRRDAVLVAPTHPLRALWFAAGRSSPRCGYSGEAGPARVRGSDARGAAARSGAYRLSTGPSDGERPPPDRSRQPQPVLDALRPRTRRTLADSSARCAARSVCPSRPSAARHRWRVPRLACPALPRAAPLRPHADHQRVQPGPRRRPRRHAARTAEGASVRRPSLRHSALRARSRRARRRRGHRRVLLRPRASQHARRTPSRRRPGRIFARSWLRGAPTTDFRAHPTTMPRTFRCSSTSSRPRRSARQGLRSRESVSPVHGLVQEYHVEYHDDDATVAWRRQPRHGEADPSRTPRNSPTSWQRCPAAVERDGDHRHRPERRRPAARREPRARRRRPRAPPSGSRGERLGVHARPEPRHRVLRPRRARDAAGLPHRPLARTWRARWATGSSSRRARSPSSRRSCAGARAVRAPGRGAPRRGAPRPAPVALRATRAEAHLVADAARGSPRARAVAPLPGTPGRLREPGRRAPRRAPRSLPRS